MTEQTGYVAEINRYVTGKPGYIKMKYLIGYMNEIIKYMWLKKIRFSVVFCNKLEKKLYFLQKSLIKNLHTTLHIWHLEYIIFPLV